MPAILPSTPIHGEEHGKGACSGMFHQETFNWGILFLNHGTFLQLHLFSSQTLNNTHIFTTDFPLRFRGVPLSFVNTLAYFISFPISFPSFPCQLQLSLRYFLSNKMLELGEFQFVVQIFTLRFQSPNPLPSSWYFSLTLYLLWNCASGCLNGGWVFAPLHAFLNCRAWDTAIERTLFLFSWKEAMLFRALSKALTKSSNKGPAPVHCHYGIRQESTTLR